MKHSTLLVAFGIATLGSSALAQQVGPKSGWMKPSAPRAGVQQPANPANGSQNLALVTHQVGGSDSCATPDVLVGTGSFPFDNSLATTGPQGQTEAACFLFNNTAVLNDVWFRWTATFNGVARFSTCGAGNSVDTKLAV